MSEGSGRRGSGRPGSGNAGDAVYGLGLIGAMVWFWLQAHGVGEHIVAVLKAFVWPAFLVYQAFRALKG
jgi:hypothetical protein